MKLTVGFLKRFKKKSDKLLARLRKKKKKNLKYEKSEIKEETL